MTGGDTAATRATVGGTAAAAATAGTTTWAPAVIAPPSAAARAAAHDRLAGLATPAGAWGRLGELAVWLSACQDRCPPRVPAAVRAVVFAGDHGVTVRGVSAYPAAVTPAMVRTIVGGGAGISVLCAVHDVALRVLDISVDDELTGVPEAVRAHKIRRGSGSIDVEDACSADEVRRALAAGAAVADEEIAAGADLLVSGDLGIGNTTPAAALIGAVLGLDADLVTGRGTGVDDIALAQKASVVRAAVDRVAPRVGDPVDLLAAAGGADFAAAAGFLVRAAERGVPVLLDGVIAVAQALVADRIAPGVAAWCAAGHRSTEPAQSLALQALGLVPLLDLGMRLGEGTGAVAAVPLVRSAAAILGRMALLADVLA
ncbi:nicotinate-nucleotide--dimethylbenzimidazole phosphoribosyltransferase [Nakamurella endophytica]|uniref:Nicotinate-nucleotide--dimethylbenzimidazole phosphoribosyltransferase n=1 Tax=Nakamurella endophytica TaxID=1748367 RepID=A0A917SJ95_9ACTN|nr:nicotinate-nucleotide--dimethylbenzimidazole phosphoribosyltransferase [Nakamurella endophytica]GGL85171.1 nicotinate-nucleotide--dimethylbenzimidazole phosphoribosyltransferase [Nakamurella endophytica]